MFYLDAAERANFEHYLEDYVAKRELLLRGLTNGVMAIVRTWHVLEHETEPEPIDYIEYLERELAKTSDLVAHLNKKGYRVRNIKLVHRKCRELAKFLLAPYSERLLADARKRERE